MRRVSLIIISALWCLGVILSLPMICAAQAPAKARVDALYKEYAKYNRQGRHRQALKYARELMSAFYENYVRGMPKIASLRRAALAQMKKNPHPYFWGAFIGLGDPR